MPVVDGLPTPERGRHVPPRNATTGPPEHPVEDRAVIGPPPTAPRDLVRQQRLQPGPFLVGYIMTMQHQKDLLHPALKIRGTRSRPACGPLILGGKDVAASHPILASHIHKASRRAR